MDEFFQQSFPKTRYTRLQGACEVKPSQDIAKLLPGPFVHGLLSHIAFSNSHLCPPVWVMLHIFGLSTEALLELSSTRVPSLGLK